MPEGIDPGFAYNPGAASLRAHAVQLFGEKVATVPAMMGARAWQSLIAAKPSLMRALDDAWVQFVNKVEAADRPHRERFVVGAMHFEDVAYLKTQNIEPLTAEIAGRNRTVKGTKQDRHIKANNALSPEEIRMIPEVVRSPEAVVFDTKNKTLLYVRTSPTDKSQKITVQPNFETSKPKRTLNSIDSSFKVPVGDFAGDQFVLVRGSLK